MDGKTKALTRAIRDTFSTGINSLQHDAIVEDLDTLDGQLNAACMISDSHTESIACMNQRIMALEAAVKSQAEPDVLRGENAKLVNMIVGLRVENDILRDINAKLHSQLDAVREAAGCGTGSAKPKGESQ